MKICFLLSSLGVGGLELYLLRFIKFLSLEQCNFEITIICRGNEKGALENQFSNLGVRILHIPGKFYSPLHYYKVIKHIKVNKYHSICDFSGPISGILMFFLSIYRINVRVASYRESRYQFSMTPFKFMYSKLSIFLVEKYSTHIISNSIASISNFHSKKFISSKLSKIFIIPNVIKDFPEVNTHKVIRFRRDLGINETDKIIGHVGRYTEAKNHKFLFDLIYKINETYPNIYLVLCGKGVGEHISNSYSELKNVIAIDHMDDVALFYNSIDLFVFPSLNEGQPNALLEALSVGTPCIASDIEANKQIAPELLSEFFVPTKLNEESMKKTTELLFFPEKFPSRNISSFIKNDFCSNKNFSLFLDLLKG